MRLINLVTITAVAASAISSNTRTEEESVAEASSTTVKPSSKGENIPYFYDEWNNFMQAIEKLADKVAEQVPVAEEGYSKRYAPFPGVIGI